MNDKDKEGIFWAIFCGFILMVVLFIMFMAPKARQEKSLLIQEAVERALEAHDRKKLE